MNSQRSRSSFEKLVILPYGEARAHVRRQTLVKRMPTRDPDVYEGGEHQASNWLTFVSSSESMYAYALETFVISMCAYALEIAVCQCQQETAVC